MSGSIYMAASGAYYYEQKLDILSNNLANINTNGFKEEKPYFRVSEVPPEVAEGLQENTISAGEPTSPLWQVLESQTVFTQGGLRATGSALDLALDGKGFFCIQAPEGVRYTRNGSFTRNAEGELTTHEGLPVLGESGTIQIDNGGRVTVDEAGNVSVGAVQVGQLRIVAFEQPNQLQRLNDSLFAPPELGAQESTPESVKVHQGFLELSNVEAVRTMTEIIEVLRGYESYQKVIQQIDETQAKAINEVGQVA